MWYSGVCHDMPPLFHWPGFIKWYSLLSFFDTLLQAYALNKMAQEVHGAGKIVIRFTLFLLQSWNPSNFGSRQIILVPKHCAQNLRAYEIEKIETQNDCLWTEVKYACEQRSNMRIISKTGVFRNSTILKESIFAASWNKWCIYAD